MFIDVRTPGENIESPRVERQLLAHCVTGGGIPGGADQRVALAALPVGRPRAAGWRGVSVKSTSGRDSEAAAADVNRYLTRDRVSNGQAARSAARALQDSNREEVDRRAIIQGWRQVVGGLDEGLIELVATAAEQRAGHRPADRLVRRVLAENRAALLAAGTKGTAAVRSGPGGGEASAQHRPPSPWILKQGMSRPGPACWWGSA